jgi:hypothetical protein
MLHDVKYSDLYPSMAFKLCSQLLAFSAALKPGFFSNDLRKSWSIFWQRLKRMS